VRIVSVGEILWDVFGETERLGGAPFNFAAHARRLGHDVVFLSAVGDDERGRRALGRMEELGLSTEFVQCVAGEATGLVTVRVDGAGQPDFTIHRPAAYDCFELGEAVVRRLAAFRPDWVYFGTLHQMDPRIRAATRRLIAALPGARRFYDINLRAKSYTAALVSELLGQANVVKLNDGEVGKVEEFLGARSRGFEAFCRDAAKRFGWEAASVTRGERGCAILVDGVYAEVEGYRVQVADTVGAGDAFAAAFVHGLGEGWKASEIGDFANRVGALVASRPGGIPEWSLAECGRMRGYR
jgi:fructokinase